MLSRRKLLISSGSVVPAAALGSSALYRDALTPKHSTMKTFCSIGKGTGALDGHLEATLLDHAGSGCLTHMWFGGEWEGYGETRIRVYVDGEAKPSIDMELALGHGWIWKSRTVGRRPHGQNGKQRRHLQHVPDSIWQAHSGHRATISEGPKLIPVLVDRPWN